jgi:hypothetical protein
MYYFLNFCRYPSKLIKLHVFAFDRGEVFIVFKGNDINFIV